MSRIVGHYAPWLLATLVGVLIVFTVVPAASSFVAWQILLVLFAAVVFLAFAIFAHSRRLCAQCIESMPLDPSEAAVRYGLRFLVAHQFERRSFALGYLAVVVGSSFLYRHPVGRYGWAAVEASLVYLLFVYVTHQRLQPWCPFCRNGGEELTTPVTPTPVSTHM
jgi:hypothetical protein